ncbi:MAG TPA: 4-alpha-glucanotransferase [Candidatus Eisenbacteria bacterium]|nr:4-alpha-glucanotransferase [Candidatus Eisenbacteria bacterium]
MSRRGAGILLHPTSLPGRFGIGDLGPEAIRFLDWLVDAGQTTWQMLPLGPTGLGDSPYVAESVFAGNPLLISPDALRDDGLVDDAVLDAAPPFREGPADFDSVRRWKNALLRGAWKMYQAAPPAGMRVDLQAFREGSAWLRDWCEFAALKLLHGGAAWTSWDPGLRDRDPAALTRVEGEIRDEVAYQEFLQFLFERQWQRLRREAHARGIRLFGDAPIYVAHDSADVWAGRDYFQLDESGQPRVVSGVPPDYFSDTGQLWGTPLYDWGRIEADGFGWWIRRLRADLSRVDLLRLDHFRGFQAYWSIPAGARDARGGHWEAGPGERLFRALQGALGGLPIVAEDLGDITDDVRALRDTLGLPGMRVLQFGVGHPESEHHPSRIPEHSFVYTGTHDNDTAVGWLTSLDEEERGRVLADLGSDAREVAWDLIAAAYHTRAECAVVPVQDVLELGSEGRMNTPAVPEGNWRFRLREGALAERAARLRRLTNESSRGR